MMYAHVPAAAECHKRSGGPAAAVQRSCPTPGGGASTTATFIGSAPLTDFPSAPTELLERSPNLTPADTRAARWDAPSLPAVGVGRLFASHESASRFGGGRAGCQAGIGQGQVRKATKYVRRSQTGRLAAAGVHGASPACAGGGTAAARLAVATWSLSGLQLLGGDNRGQVATARRFHGASAAPHACAFRTESKAEPAQPQWLMAGTGLHPPPPHQSIRFHYVCGRSPC